MSRPPITHEDMKAYRKIKFRQGKVGKRIASFVFRVIMVVAAAAGAVGIVVAVWSVFQKGRNTPRSFIAINDDPRPLTSDFLYSGFSRGKSASPPVPNGSAETKSPEDRAAEEKAQSSPSRDAADMRNVSVAMKKKTLHVVNQQRQQVPRSWERVRTGYYGDGGGAYVSGVRDLVLVYKEYPAEAKKMRMEGQCLLVCVIRRNGSLKHVEIVKSTGHTLLDNQALNAVRSVGRFPPVPSSLPGDEISIDIPFAFYIEKP